MRVRCVEERRRGWHPSDGWPSRAFRWLDALSNVVITG